MPGLNLALDPSLKPPTDLEAKLLRQIVLAGMPDQVNVSFGDIYLFDKWRFYECKNKKSKTLY